jgi:hypothetical protein
MRHGMEGEALKIEVSIKCLVDQIISQARMPIKEYRYRVEGDVLIIEVVVDVESILNTVLSK